MTRNEELATAFEAAAHACGPQALGDQQVGGQFGQAQNIDLNEMRQERLVSRVLSAVGQVYRKLADEGK